VIYTNNSVRGDVHLVQTLNELGVSCDTAANRRWKALSNGELVSAAKACLSESSMISERPEVSSKSYGFGLRALLLFAATTGTEGRAVAFFAAVAIFSLLSNVSFPGFIAAPPASLDLISSAPICATRSAVHSAT
jgi:hypothetical protein